MRIRIRFRKTFWTGRLGRVLLALALLVVVAGAGTFLYFWNYHSLLIDAHMSGQIFDHA